MQGGSGGVEGWQDVGGLADVREALQEALELPTKYAALIARLPTCPGWPSTCFITLPGLQSYDVLPVCLEYHCCDLLFLFRRS